MLRNPHQVWCCCVSWLCAGFYRRAFKALAFTKLDRVPLYLEWAPADALTVPPPTAAAAPIVATPSASVAEVEGESVVTSDKTVYVKNLNFASTEEGLRHMFSHIGPVRCVE